MPEPTFLFHDYETFGSDPRRDRPVQFAAQRTTTELEPVGPPVVLWCRPPRDVLPHPTACTVTGITPQEAERLGMLEAEFAADVHDLLAEPGTCAVGYNSIRFDDEVTRHLLYRNFHDPYAREWEHGNSRWDLIDLARMAFALRPDGLEWPLREDGCASFRLEDLAKANGLLHTRAHDATSDVEATLALARKLRAAQPRLYAWSLRLRNKRHALSLLDWARMTPVLHVSSRFPAERGCLAMVAPVCEMPGQANAVVVFDLDADPAPLADLRAEEIADRVYTPRRDLPYDVQRLPLKVVRANRCPALAPLKVLDGADLGRIRLDRARCLANLDKLRAIPDLATKVRAAMVPPARQDLMPEDADAALYGGGFLPDADRAKLLAVRTATPAQLAEAPPALRDPRYVELLFRYRARNWPDTLSDEETERWRRRRRARLVDGREEGYLGLHAFEAEVAMLRQSPATTPHQHTILDALEAWARELVADLEPAHAHAGPWTRL